MQNFTVALKNTCCSFEKAHSPADELSSKRGISSVHGGVVFRLSSITLRSTSQELNSDSFTSSCKTDQG